MLKPKIIVLSGYGLNCEEETKFAFEKAGGVADIVHINDLIDHPAVLKRYQIMAMPGGFSYGDDTGSGNAYASKLSNHIWGKIKTFVEDDKLVIGICNGFQILVNLGLLPALKMNYGERQVSLLHNDTARYIDRWVDIKVQNDSPWLKNIDEIMVPIAHGEGKLYADPKMLQTLKDKKLIALRYVKGDVCTFQDLPANPTGTIDDIAGITDETKRVLGLMPHPERAMFFTQLPHWTYQKEQLKRSGKKIPTEGPGLQIFKNAIHYFK